MLPWVIADQFLKLHTHVYLTGHQHGPWRLKIFKAKACDEFRPVEL